MNLNRHFVTTSTQNLLSTVQLIILFSILLMGSVGCDLLVNEDDSKTDLLHVMFSNDSSSTYTITSIQLQAMGKADQPAEPSGEWGENILPAGTRLAPGSYTFFDLEIPNLHWSQYRLGVDDGNGNNVILPEQPGYDQTELPITHWGSDDRTVSVTLVYNPYSKLIEWSGWTDFAGIE